MSKYVELYPDTFSGTGLLSAISELASCPWHSSVDKTTVEIQYAVTSAQKQMVSNFEKVSPTLRPAVVLAFFIDKWKRLYDTYKLEYQTLSPYSVKEVGEHSQTNTRAETNNYGGTISESGSGNVTSGSTENYERAVKASIYGFNSTASSPSDDSTTTDEKHDTLNQDTTNSRSVQNGGSDSLTRNDDETRNYTVNKTGNLGFITAQDIIEKEFNVWATPFFEKVFADVNSMIALKIY